MTAQRFGRDLTTGSIPRHLIMFSLPMLAGSVLQTAYSFVNAFWVGNYLSNAALAAITVSFPVVFVLVAVGAGLTLATNILVSQYYGARDMASVRRVANSSMIMIMALSLVLMGLGELLAPLILRAMDTPPDVLDIATHYLRIFLLTLPIMFGAFLTRSMLQGIGDSTTVLYFQTGALVINTVLDPVLMFGWLGMPELGLNGTAWASVIAQTLALAALIIYLRKKENLVAPTFSGIHFDWEMIWITCRIGFPSAVQQSLVSVGMVFVTGMIGEFGEETLAAFGAASRIDQLAFMPAMTFSLAVSTLTGQNIGAGRYDRIRPVFWWGCLLSGGVTLVASALAVSVPHMLIQIFTNDSAVIEPGVEYLQIVGFCYVFFAIMFVSNGVINGSGHTMVTTIISLVSLWIVRVPLGLYLSREMESVHGVWIAIAASFGVSMIASLCYYLTGRWRRAVLTHRVPPVPEAIFGEETGEA